MYVFKIINLLDIVYTNKIYMYLYICLKFICKHIQKIKQMREKYILTELVEENVHYITNALTVD